MSNFGIALSPKAFVLPLIASLTWHTAFALPTSSPQTPAVVNTRDQPTESTWSLSSPPHGFTSQSGRVELRRTPPDHSDLVAITNNSTQPLNAHIPDQQSLLSSPLQQPSSSSVARQIPTLDPFRCILEVDWRLLNAIYRPEDRAAIIDKLRSKYDATRADLHRRLDYLANHIDVGFCTPRRLITHVSRGYNQALRRRYGCNPTHLMTDLPAKDAESQKVDARLAKILAKQGAKDRVICLCSLSRALQVPHHQLAHRLAYLEKNPFVFRLDFSISQGSSQGQTSLRSVRAWPERTPEDDQLDGTDDLPGSNAPETSSFLPNPEIDRELLRAIYDRSLQDQIITELRSNQGKDVTSSGVDWLRRLQYLADHSDYGSVPYHPKIERKRYSLPRRNLRDCYGSIPFNLLVDQNPTTVTGRIIDLRLLQILQNFPFSSQRLRAFRRLSRLLDIPHGHLAHRIEYLQKKFARGLGRSGSAAKLQVGEDLPLRDSLPIPAKLLNPDYASDDDRGFNDSDQIDHLGAQTEASNSDPAAHLPECSSEAQMSGVNGLEILSRAASQPLEVETSSLADQESNLDEPQETLILSVDELRALGDAFNQGLAAMAMDDHSPASIDPAYIPGIDCSCVPNHPLVDGDPMSDMPQAQHESTIQRNQSGNSQLPILDHLRNPLSESIIRTQLFERTYHTLTEKQINASIYLQAVQDFIYLSQEDPEVLNWRRDGVNALNSAILRKQTQGAMLLSETPLLRMGDLHPRHRIRQSQICPLHQAVVIGMKIDKIDALVDHMLTQDTLQLIQIIPEKDATPIWAIRDWSGRTPLEIALEGSARGLPAVFVHHLEQALGSQDFYLRRLLQANARGHNALLDAANRWSDPQILARLLTLRDRLGGMNYWCTNDRQEGQLTKASITGLDNQSAPSFLQVTSTMPESKIHHSSDDAPQVSSPCKLRQKRRASDLSHHPLANDSNCPLSDSTGIVNSPLSLGVIPAALPPDSRNNGSRLLG